MQGQWQTIVFKVIGWLTAEILLTLLNLDTIADYSEFVFRQDIATASPSHTGAITLTTTLSCPWIAGLCSALDSAALQSSPAIG